MKNVFQRAFPIALFGAAGLFFLVGGAIAAQWWRGDAVTAFFRQYYGDAPGGEPRWGNTYWLGVPTLKLPLDMWVYQEILAERRPDVLIETGTYRGGSALYFATVFDALGKGRVLTIDIEDFPGKPAHPRITYLIGSSTGPEILARVKAAIAPGERVMVVLDSDHRMPHVLSELRLYAPLVTPGDYMVVEDTNINGHPNAPDFGPGPWEAAAAFLRESDRFAPDRSREKFLVTFNPGGWLKRVR